MDSEMNDSPPPTPTLEVEDTPTIGTHNGVFHCDEALACFMLKQTDKYKNAKIIRTRNPSVLAKCDIIVDVGGEYDPSRNRFDHHQRDFNDTFSDDSKIKLSSAGLIYKHFGREILQRLVNFLDSHLAESDFELLYQQVYHGFIKPLDGIDNGIPQFNSNESQNYNVGTDLSSRVSYMNPAWNESKLSDNDIMERFVAAGNMAGAELEQFVKIKIQQYFPARSIVFDAVKNRHQHHPSGVIVVFDQYVPWRSHLMDAEKELKCEDELLYVIFPNQSGQYHVQCVPKQDAQFENRKSMPKEWCGLSGTTLDAVVGIPGCIFVHAGGFIGGHDTLSGAIEMAAKAINETI